MSEWIPSRKRTKKRKGEMFWVHLIHPPCTARHGPFELTNRKMQRKHVANVQCLDTTGALRIFVTEDWEFKKV